MNIWFYINAFIFVFVLWQISKTNLSFHIIFGFIGFVFIMYNWTRHALFATIRSNIRREQKIRFANFTKRFGWIHKWSGTSALLFIILHSAFVLNNFPFQSTNSKFVSGLIALLSLFFVVLFGWLRYWRTTIRRRYLHWTFAYILVFLVIIHLLL